MASIPYREQVQRLREDAIVGAVNRLLVAKGYELMTVDEVAAEAGLSKASLYKHFTSKEELAAAAMIRLLERAIAQIAEQQRLSPQASALAQIETLVRWTLKVQLDGEMPSLPAANSRLTAALRQNRVYTDRLLALSDLLGEWIVTAQTEGTLDAALPPEVILYTLFARACDPVLAVLKAAGQHSEAEIVEWLVRSTFKGIGAPAAATVAAAVPAPPGKASGAGRPARAKAGVA